MISACLIAGPAHAQSKWYPISETTGVDVASINRRGIHPTIWSIEVYLITNDQGVDYRLSRYEFDCVRENMKQLAATGYNIEGGAEWSDDTPTTSHAVPPGTVGSAIMHIACDGVYDQSFPFIDDPSRYTDLIRALEPAAEDGVQR